jgi:hypothetical protein
MWENTVAIHSILKEKNYKVKYLTSSILKKIKLTNIILGKKNKKKRGKKKKCKKKIKLKKQKKNKKGKKREEKMQKKKKEKYTATIKINFPRLLAY